MAMSEVRTGRPGLLRTVTRTAVVTGTAEMTAATTVDHHLGHPAVPVAAGDDLVSQLALLARLRDADALSEEEFQAAKRRLLRR
jgi:hypothetical protein